MLVKDVVCSNGVQHIFENIGYRKNNNRTYFQAKQDVTKKMAGFEFVH